MSPYGFVRERPKISMQASFDSRPAGSDGRGLPESVDSAEDELIVLTFLVSGQANLFADLVSALIQSALPEATVTLDSSVQADTGGVRVSLESTDRWLFVSIGRGPDARAAEALSHGAVAALSLDSRAEDFQRALDALVRGEGHYVPAEMVRWLAGATLRKGADGKEPESSVRLTFRERQVLHLVAVGLSNSEIAQTLMISANTVRSHLHALSVKLDATSRTRMLANARALGLPEANGDQAGNQLSA